MNVLLLYFLCVSCHYVHMYSGTHLSFIYKRHTQGYFPTYNICVDEALKHISEKKFFILVQKSATFKCYTY